MSSTKHPVVAALERHRKCKHCRYWVDEGDSWPDDDDPTATSGECRRHAPTSTAAGEGIADLLREFFRVAHKMNVISRTGVAFFPRTISSDWCGDFAYPRTGVSE